MRLNYFLIIISFIYGLSCSAQNDKLLKRSDSTSTWNLLKQDSRNTWGGFTYSISRPAHWKKKDIKKLGLLLASVATLSLADKSTNSFFLRQEPNAPQLLKDFGWYFGSPQNYFMVNAGLYGFGLLTKNEKVRKTSVLIISSSVTTGLIQTFSKNTFGRARPNSQLGPYEFRFLASESGFHSFPSGHTILSITMAHAIAKQFNNTWAKVAVYSVGAIPPLSRLTANAHWLTDIAFSTAISIIVVDSIDTFLNTKQAYRSSKSEYKKNITWNLTFKPNQIGVIGTF